MTQTAVILTALEVEFLAVRSHLSMVVTERHSGGTIYDVGRYTAGGCDWRVAVVQTGPGNVDAAIEAVRAIAQFCPAILMFVGVAGGLKDVSLGDVVAATKVYGYETGKAEASFRTRTDIGESSHSMIQLAMKVTRDRQWQVKMAASGSAARAFVKPIAAGEKVVSDTRSEIFKLLREHFSDAVAVEMEGLGVLKAARANPEVQVLIVRGISDLIDKKSESDAKGSQEVASANAAAFAFELLGALPNPNIQLGPATAVANELDDGALWWRALERVAVELYPRGPTDNEIWTRAGGDISVLDLDVIGKAAWHSALRKLRSGGGGRFASPESLVRAMKGDFPNNPSLASLVVSRVSS